MSIWWKQLIPWEWRRFGWKQFENRMKSVLIKTIYTMTMMSISMETTICNTCSLRMMSVWVKTIYGVKIMSVLMKTMYSFTMISNWMKRTNSVRMMSVWVKTVYGVRMMSVFAESNLQCWKGVLSLGVFYTFNILQWREFHFVLKLTFYF